MRERWNRASAMHELSKAELERLIKPAFPGASVVNSDFTKGGLANTNIRVDLSTRDEPVLLRIFDRAPQEAEKENRIYELIDGVVACPKIYYFENSDSIINRPYTIMEFVKGERLEVVAKSVDHAQIAELGRAVGEALATVHSIKFPKYGFFDQSLDVAEQLDMGSLGLLQYAHKCLFADIGGERLGVDLSKKVVDFIQREGQILDQWPGPPSLTHSDFGGSNILVSKNDGNVWNVAAILDWEFAFSGTPFFDFGNLLRKPLGVMPGFQKSFQEGYMGTGVDLPVEWREMSLITDLTAWLEFLTRPAAGEHLIEDARRTIVETMIHLNF